MTLGPGGQFLVQRWEVPHPDAPDGIAIIGFDRGRETLLQHYFDSRGVARAYEMSLTDGTTIDGRWEISSDGSSWEHDFDVTYTKVE